MRAASAAFAGGRLPLWPLLALLAVGVGIAAWAAGHDPLQLALLLIVAPLIEEAVFRAGVQEALLRQRSKGLTANLLTALAFGLVHALVRGDLTALAVAVPALLIGAAYNRWRQLRLCVALHAAMNAVWIVFATGL